jgi:serine/threonine protein kinase
MPTYESAPGKERAWNLLKKLGEGDAGEVFLVESILDKQVAILKRPRRSAFTTDAIRQSSQIEQEAHVLNALAPLAQSSNRLHIPRLLDQARVGNEFSERFFIVITRASGFDLGFLARAVRFGALETNALPAELYSDLDGTQRAYLERLAQTNEIPALILLRSMSAAIEFLETIHKFEFQTASSHHYGIIWNDVKPDHFFWDPILSRLTLIDWGNAHFLEADGSTTDRQNSRLDDYVQLMSAMGSFLSAHAPSLFEKLAWKEDIAPSNAYIEGIKPLQERITTVMGETIAQLRLSRQKEAELTSSNTLDFNRFSQLSQIHSQIVNLGEIPDYRAAEKCFLRLAAVLVEAGRWPDFQKLCDQVDDIPALDKDNWLLLGKIAEHAATSPTFQRALRAAIKGDWPNALWEMRTEAYNYPSPAWWEDLSRQVRSLHLGISKDAVTPFVAFNRLIHALQALALGTTNTSPQASFLASNPNIENEALKKQIEQLVSDLRQEVLARWIQSEPDPPDSGIDYQEIERYLPLASQLLPGPAQAVINALDQPRAQVKIVLDAWNRREFDTSRHALRHNLIWDPDRLRLLTADKAIQSTPEWLEALRRGPRKDESLSDFVTCLELDGRELRNQVGPAPWLDSILDALSSLRKGAEPTDVLMEFSGLRNDLGWLLEMEHDRPLLELPDKPVRLERLIHLPQIEETLRGIQEAKLGLDYDISLTDPLDTWVAEARGSSARVFQGYLRTPGTQHYHTAAVKVMRPDRADYAQPLFREEVQILLQMRNISGVVPMLEFGFMQLEDGTDLPPEDRQFPASHLTGSVLRFGLDSIHNYLQQLAEKTSQGWLPYIATIKLENSENLLLLCDTSYTRGRIIPLLEGLRMSIQICEILESAHSRNISYRDHKILHYYWQESTNGIYAIDWNIARRHPEGITLAEAQFDLVQFAARTLHHIITGRPAPGALPLGPTRPEEIEAAARSYTVRWTYDDQRLPTELKDIIEKSLSGGYSDARRLRDDLYHQFQAISQLIPKE